MLVKRVEKFVDVLIERDISKYGDRDLIIYGLCTGIEIAFNILTTIVLAFLFKLIIESIVFLIFFSFIRTYTGGYHCQNAINCYFLSSSAIVIVLMIIKITPKEWMYVVCIITLVISVPTILKFAPVETATKPLDEDERKYYRKKVIAYLFIECVVVLLLFLLRLKQFGFVICLSIMVSACLIVMQKLVGRKWRLFLSGK